MIDKVFAVKEAIAKIEDGSRVMIGGFGLRGSPDKLIDELVASQKKRLTVISNDLGSPNIGIGRLLTNGQIKALIGSHYNFNPEVSEKYNAGLIDVTIVPQGTLAESIRAAGAGIPAYYTRTCVDTTLEKGKEVKYFNGQKYVMEEAIGADYAIIHAKKADRLGNLVFSKTARTFNPLMAMAARFTIVEVEEIVEPGELDPESIVVPHVYVNAIVKVDKQ